MRGGIVLRAIEALVELAQCLLSASDAVRDGILLPTSPPPLCITVLELWRHDGLHGVKVAHVHMANWLADAQRNQRAECCGTESARNRLDFPREHPKFF